MTTVKELELMNLTQINYLKKLNLDTSRNEIISKILEDRACFFKIEKEDAFLILKDIGIKDSEVNNMYNNLVSSKEYYELQNEGIIDETDNEIKIKYDKYAANDLFKNDEKVNKISEENNMFNIRKNFFIKILDKIINIFK